MTAFRLFLGSFCLSAFVTLFCVARLVHLSNRKPSNPNLRAILPKILRRVK